MKSRRRESTIRGTIGGAKGMTNIIGELVLMYQLLVMLFTTAAEELPACQRVCGDVEIPYPFGIGPPHCFREDGFDLTCSKTNDSRGYKPFNGNVEVTNISLASGQVRIYNAISWQCYNKELAHRTWVLDLNDTPYRLSNISNKFTVIGCDTLAYIGGRKNEIDLYESGCVSMCRNGIIPTNGSCTGIGCCQTSIPSGLSFYNVWFDAKFNSSDVQDQEFNPCSFAVLLEEDQFEFQSTYVTKLDFYSNNGWPVGKAPVVLDWAIGNETCEQAQRNQTTYACISDHSHCVGSPGGHGYLCNCSSGYRGNPYVHGADGCQDINECDDQRPCAETATCTNAPGNFSCSCPPGTHGDPQKGGTCYPCPPGTHGDPQIGGTCYPNNKLSLTVKLVIGNYFLSMPSNKQRMLMRVKKRYFQQNGGWQLLHEIRSNQGLAFMIFTKEELEQATNKFDKSCVLGHGGYGTVYKGILTDNRTVAIKKSKMIDERLKKEFGKEMIILSQINHKNVVKLLGCCLEVEVPMLVYEFVSNGTLFQLIHEKSHRVPISLDLRLKVASESAGALAYLHSSASPPIIHGDVKPSNILLDDNYTAKVSDFGASMLVPMDETQCATLVQGTCGYLDPEVLQTYHLTDKSDVYSFGVVLLELLTGKKALYFEGSKDEKSLASTFISAMKENQLLQLLDGQIKNEEDMDVIQAVAELANQCLNFRGQERPSMDEVAEKLDRLRKFKLHPWVQHPEEIERLLEESSNYRETDTTRHYSLEKIAALDIESGR
uniref:Wall-associated receptor kinase 5-like n=1 Tax=Elaeis guineensis var. tenera TaxID=51953 RepID=A0A6J0PP45_ELAGV|nr:wall-associated receptor kinase 5-like [Elaeis guineensis]